MKLKSGVYKKSRQKRALELAKKQLNTLVQLQEKHGKDYPVDTRKQSKHTITVPVSVKIAQKKKLIENINKAMTSKVYT